MRLIFFIYLIVISEGCVSHKDCDSTTETICDIANTVHHKYPFQIDTIKKKYGLNEAISVIFHDSKPVKHVYMRILDKELDCGKLKFVLLKDRDDFRANHFLYYSYIGIEYLNEDSSKIRFRRFKDELFDRPGVGVGLDFSTSENYYMSNINGEWKIDSLVHDIQY